MERLRFLSFGSSSSGNCYYVGNGSYGFLIDAGMPVKHIKHSLKEYGLLLENIFGIFLTHDHFDHIKYVGVFGEKHNIPIYATAEVFDGINRNSQIEPKPTSCRKFFKKCDIVSIRDFTVQSFPVSHDASDAMGFAINYRNQTIVIATDLGFVGKEAADHIAKANYLVIEANYDENMLKTGAYPYHLKQRVSSHTGHLSNTHTANFLADNWHENLSHVFLCHISGDNNTSELALEAVQNALNAKQITPKVLCPLPRLTPSEMYIFN